MSSSAYGRTRKSRLNFVRTIKNDYPAIKLRDSSAHRLDEGERPATEILDV
jgi:hypothetical protein